MATCPWVRPGKNQGHDIEEHPNLKRWMDEIDARPAVQRGLKVLADRRRDGPMSDRQREMMFGKTPYEQRCSEPAMKAVIYERYGADRCLRRIVDLPGPVAGPGAVMASRHPSRIKP